MYDDDYWDADSEDESPSAVSIFLEFYSPSDCEYTEVEVTIDLDYSPDEYEGNYLFSRGGIDVADWHINPFKWNGKEMNKIIPEMLTYSDEAVDNVHTVDIVSDERFLNQIVAKLVQNKIDRLGLKVPSKQYPDSRC